jgi:hypothetical protein
MFFLAAEFGITFLKASPQNSAELLFAKVGCKILCPILGALSEPRLSELALIESDTDKSSLNFVLYALSG